MSALRELAEQLKADDRLCAEDTLKLRREIWPNGAISTEEAELLLEMNDTLARSPEWLDFFVEALCHYMVHQVEPRRHISPENAEWLMARIGSDGHLDTLGEIELVVKILETAHSAPDTLRSFALEEVARVVLTGIGPTRCGSQHRPGQVTAPEAALLRRLLFASGSEWPGAISQAEAELLFRIKDATLDADNHEDWERLFVQGVGNYLMAYGGHDAVDRDEAALLAAFARDSDVRVLGFLGRVGQAAVAARGFRGGANAEPVDREAAERAARAIAADELAWLQARLDEDTARDALEVALLAFLAEESGNLALPR
ncbi:hypothetical protein [Stakelama tenebrarum]|uniref:Uncharacterized protein n=1 Tax=Stakelama tenebrarum TaxID=2711215 RepID=A0A6G6Y5R6_9SPHN|nr:hypothetical protein [Sphingosinithalassobacter tenebrarum]QIG80137.1 hypothetical protein G5C33_10330 [Sphingosinithalassobacter tenebrarum]